MSKVQIRLHSILADASMVVRCGALRNLCNEHTLAGVLSVVSAGGNQILGTELLSSSSPHGSVLVSSSHLLTPFLLSLCRNC